jgi:hypothetical protein
MNSVGVFLTVSNRVIRDHMNWLGIVIRVRTPYHLCGYVPCFPTSLIHPESVTLVVCLISSL